MGQPAMLSVYKRSRLLWHTLSTPLSQRSPGPKDNYPSSGFVAPGAQVTSLRKELVWLPRPIHEAARKASSVTLVGCRGGVGAPSRAPDLSRCTTSFAPPTQYIPQTITLHCAPVYDMPPSERSTLRVTAGWAAIGVAVAATAYSNAPQVCLQHSTTVSEGVSQFRHDSESWAPAYRPTNNLMSVYVRTSGELVTVSSAALLHCVLLSLCVLCRSTASRSERP